MDIFNSVLKMIELMNSNDKSDKVKFMKRLINHQFQCEPFSKTYLKEMNKKFLDF